MALATMTHTLDDPTGRAYDGVKAVVRLIADAEHANAFGHNGSGIVGRNIRRIVVHNGAIAFQAEPNENLAPANSYYTLVYELPDGGYTKPLEFQVPIAGGTVEDNLIDPPADLPTLLRTLFEAHLADAVDAHDASAISFVPTGTIAATDVQAAVAEVATDAAVNLAAEAVLARNADNLTSGTVADARIASTIARDSEVTSAVAAEATARTADVDAEETRALAAEAVLAGDIAGLDADLGNLDTEVATLDAQNVKLTGNQTVAGTKTFSSAPSVPDASFAQSKVVNLVSDLAGKQPVDADLTAIAALATTAFGRSLLELANGAALAGAIPSGTYVEPGLFDANTIVKADADNTPTPMAVPASTLVGRKSTGAIAALTSAEAMLQVLNWVDLTNLANTAARQAAIDAAPGGVFYFSIATIAVTATLSFPANSTLITFDTTFVGDVSNDAVFAFASRCKHIGTMTIDGQNRPGSIGYKLVNPGASNCQNVNLDDVWVKNCAVGADYHADSGGAGGVYFNTVERLRVNAFSRVAVRLMTDGGGSARVNANSFGYLMMQNGTARTVSDGATTDTSTTVTSATAAFDANDIGAPISGAGIPAKTFIVSVTNATTVVVSAAATATATGVSVTISSSGLLANKTNGTSISEKVEAESNASWALNLMACLGFSTTAGWLEGNTGNIRIGDNPAVTGVYLSLSADTTLTSGDAKYAHTMSDNRSVEIDNQTTRQSYGRVGCSGTIQIGDDGTAANDQNRTDRIHIAGAVRCYRPSAGSPNFAFIGATDTGFSFSSDNGSSPLYEVNESRLFTYVPLRAQVGGEWEPPFSFGADADTGMYQGGSNVLGFAIGGFQGAHLSEPADGDTALLIRRNVGGTSSLQRVSMGAADSGAAGFKVLRVPN